MMLDSSPSPVHEARKQHRLLQDSHVAFAYFDADDRLCLWNPAYVALNFKIADLIREGALFADLLTELVIRGQINIDGTVQDWIDARLAARASGGTALRHLADGRVFLVQERKDACGGTQGFWADISDLYRSGGLQPVGDLAADMNVPLRDPSLQEFLRNKLQTIIGSLQLHGEIDSHMDRADMIATSILAAQQICVKLDELRDLGALQSPEARKTQLPALREA